MRHLSLGRRTAGSFALLLAFLTTGPGLAADPPLLVPNAATHSDDFIRCRFLSGKKVITASNDKSLRVWDLATRRTTQVIRTPQAVGIEGRIIALEVLPDAKSVVVAGYGLGGDHGQIYLISLTSGQIERVFEGHTGWVNGLAVSKDGTRVASGGQDATARVWDVKTGRQVSTFTGHSDEVNAVAFSPDGDSVVSVSKDKTGQVWDAATGKRQASLTGHTDFVQGVDWSRDGKKIVTGSWDMTAKVWSPDGQLLRTLDDIGNASAYAVRITADSKRVGLTNASLPGKMAPWRYRLFDLDNGRYLAGSDSWGASVTDLAFAPDEKTVAVCGGMSREARFLDPTSGEVKMPGLAPASYQVSAVGWAEGGRAMCWGGSPDEPAGVNNPDEEKAARKLVRQFDLTTLTFRTDPRGFDAPFRNRSIEKHFVYNGLEGVTYRPSGKMFPVQEKHDYFYSSPSLGPQNDRAVLGSNRGGVWVFDPDTGNLIQKLVGHNGRVTDAVFNKDGKLILSGGFDRTVRVWRPGAKSDPLVSLYTAGSEWVAWTPEGYYAASPGGEKLIGWLESNGPTKVPTFHPAEHFHDKLYRPDVIKLLLDSDDTLDALRKANRAAGREAPDKDDLGLDAAKPPKVEFVGVPKPDRDGRVTVKAKATSQSDAKIKGFTLLVKGDRRLGDDADKETSGTLAAETYEWADVQLDPGENLITVEATGTDGVKGSAEVRVTYQAVVPPPKNRPTLHVFIAAIDNYEKGEKDDGMPALFMSEKGAELFRKTIQEYVGNNDSPYEKVAFTTLTGRQATRKDLADALARFAGGVNSNRDVALVYLSGHGVMVNKAGKLVKSADAANGEQWTFCPFDFRQSQPTRTGLTDDDLCDALKKAKARRVGVVVDACFSGAMARKANQSGINFDVLCSSAADQKSIEDRQFPAPVLTHFAVLGLKNQLDKDLVTELKAWQSVGVTFRDAGFEVRTAMSSKLGMEPICLPSTREGELFITTPPKKK